MAPPSLLDLAEAPCICCSILIMAAWLSRSVMQKSSSWLQLCPAALARFCSRGVGSTSSDTGPVSSFKDKPRTVEDLPHVSFSEMFYRMIFQGFYNRVHELQVPGCSALTCMVSGSHIYTYSLMYECFNLHLKMLHAFYMTYSTNPWYN